MKVPTFALGRWNLHRLGIILGLCSVSSFLAPLGVRADRAVDIRNTAGGSFRTDPTGAPVAVESNSTSVPATLVSQDRPALEIIKSGDRTVGEPGDTVLYRLVIRNTGLGTAQNITIQDTLPQGFQFLPNTVRAGLTVGNSTTPIADFPAPTVNGRVITFRYPGSLAPRSQTLSIVYGALLTPDAIRGTGRNLAVSEGTDPRFGRYVSNTASHRLQIRPGILSDCGTIVGRVFVDKNFDGAQQPGEPGVPNAVIFLEDGNRITTDSNGLFSLQYVLAGSHVGTLDLTSLPGYTLAPNLYRIEGNSPSRLVNLPPGGLARMNFAVTPTFGEGQP